jgi:hypothetical protein
MPVSNQFTPNATDQLFDPTSGTLTEIGRHLIRNLGAAVGALAPLNARYWLSTSDPTLTNEQNLGALVSGYLKLTTAIGIATPSTVTTIPQADITGLVAALALKRSFTPRVDGTASSATPTPNADTTDLYSLTAQAAAAAFGNPTGTPVNGQALTIRIKDNGTARALTWGTAYVAGGVALPTTTVISKILTLGFIYNTDNALNKWQLISSAQEV